MGSGAITSRFDTLLETTSTLLTMVDYEKEEASNLQKEFEWVLNQEVHKSLDQIHQFLWNVLGDFQWLFMDMTIRANKTNLCFRSRQINLKLSLLLLGTVLHMQT
nr:unnamed protein product [Callosobruchus chinensis]